MDSFLSSAASLAGAARPLPSRSRQPEEVTSPSKPSSLQGEAACPHPALPAASRGLGKVLWQPLPRHESRAGQGFRRHQPHTNKDTEPYLLRPPWASQGCSAAFSVSGPCKQASITLPVGPDLPGLHIQTSATAGTPAKRLLPGWLPQAQCLHPRELEATGGHSRLSARCLPPRQSQDLQVGASGERH